MKEKINDRLLYLYVMLNNYHELNLRTHHKYDLPNDDWDECFKEDLHLENLD